MEEMGFSAADFKWVAAMTSWAVSTIVPSQPSRASRSQVIPVGKVGTATAAVASFIGSPLPLEPDTSKIVVASEDDATTNLEHTATQLPQLTETSKMAAQASTAGEPGVEPADEEADEAGHLAEAARALETAMVHVRLTTRVLKLTSC
jgi:hypothetical protein